MVEGAKREIRTNTWQLEVDEDAPVYEHIVDIPLTREVFFFNGGHVENQLLPYLEELVTEYGAQPIKIKKRKGEGYEVFIGIEPDQLFAWAKNRLENLHLAQSPLSETILMLIISILNVFPEGPIQKHIQEIFNQKDDVRALRTIMFGFRQQIGQYFTPENQMMLIEQAIEANKIDLAQQRLDALQRTLIGFERQLAAGNIFFESFREFISHKENRRFFAVKDLRFELEVMSEMIASAEEVMTQETLYQVQIETLQAKINRQSGQPSQQ
jgi:hypothetical protein